MEYPKTNVHGFRVKSVWRASTPWHGWVYLFIKDLAYWWISGGWKCHKLCFDFIFVYGPSHAGSTQRAYVGTRDSGSSLRIAMASPHHSLCHCVIICKPMRCAVKFCCGRRGSGMEARPQGRGGRTAGQSKPSINGKHTFLQSLNCPFYYSGGEVAGVQERPGVQRQRHDFKIGAQPCRSPWLLWRGQSRAVENKCRCRRKNEREASSIRWCDVSTFESPGFFIRCWATSHKTHNGGEKQVWRQLVG